MGNDLDYSNVEVREDAINWGIWIAQRLGLAGFRLDAVKHFSSDFLHEWIAHLDSNLDGQPLVMIGEYWRDDLPTLGRMIEKFRGRLRLFDVMLAGNMSKLSIADNGDMRLILNNTLMKHYPNQGVVRPPYPL
jgi:alpha-amylase